MDMIKLFAFYMHVIYLPMLAAEMEFVLKIKHRKSIIRYLV